MRRFQKAIMIYLSVFLLITVSFSAHAATPQDWDSNAPELLEGGHLFAESAIVIDAQTGDILFSKNPDARMFPASTTKIMTLMLALESGMPLDTVVTIPEEAVDVPEGSSKVPVSAGEQMTFIDLLYGFMLNSGNDGAKAIAILVSGSESEFVKLMNSRARQLGCESTNFANSHGYHEDNHYTTARDMSKIAQQAMKSDVFKKIVSTSKYTMASTNKRSKLVITTKVELVNPESKYYYENCIGIKTGFTSKAGQCLVSAADFDRREVITVAFHSTVDYVERKWYDTSRMFEYSKTRYDSYSVRDLFEISDESIKSILVENPSDDDESGGELPLILSQTSDDGYTFMALKDTGELQEYIDYFNTNAVVTCSTDYLTRLENREIIEAGSIIGTLSFKTEQGETITGTLIASRRVNLKPIETSTWRFLTDSMPWLKVFENVYVIYVIIGAAVLIVVIITICSVQSVKRARRRRRIYEQRRRAYYERMRAERREGGGNIRKRR